MNASDQTSTTAGLMKSGNIRLKDFLASVLTALKQLLISSCLLIAALR